MSIKRTVSKKILKYVSLAFAGCFITLNPFAAFECMNDVKGIYIYIYDENDT